MNLASISESSGTLIRPIPKDIINEKDRCPSTICGMKRFNPRSWMITCDACKQTYVRCVGLTKKKTDAIDNYKCPFLLVIKNCD